MKKLLFLLFLLLGMNLLSFSQDKQAPISNVRKISATQGGFTGVLHSGDDFGAAVSIGDLNGDGIDDLAVGAILDDESGTNSGAVWILIMNRDKTVKSFQKINDVEGNFSGILDSEDHFGAGISSLGDFDGDNIPDLLVGSPYDDDGSYNSGAVWILLLNSDGTVKNYHKISATTGGLANLTSNRAFGNSVCSLGDLDGDQIIDIAVGVPNYDADGGSYKGSVWILFLNADGSVKKQTILNDYHGGFGYSLDNDDRFGSWVENIGDIDGDGIIDLGVASTFDDDGANDAGAFYILFLNRDGTIHNSQKISATTGGFSGAVSSEDLFGRNITPIGDLNGDGVNDIAVSSSTSDIGGTDRGAIWLLYLNNNGTVKDYSEINSLNIELNQRIDNSDKFGFSLSTFSEYENGKLQLIVGARGDDDGFTDAGAVYIMDLEVTESKQAPISNVRKISATQGGFSGLLHAGDYFATPQPIGDIDGDGVEDLAVGALLDDDGGTENGAVWILFMNEDRSVKSHQKISETSGGFTGNLSGSRFGCDVEPLGDLNGDGVKDIAIGANYDDDGGTNSGAVWILFLNSNGTVKSHQKISSTQGGLIGLGANRFFGGGIANLGDVNNDGLLDIAVGVPNYDADGGLYRGSIWMLSLNNNGTVHDQFIVSEGRGGFTVNLDNSDMFGRHVKNVGDINRDGIIDIAVTSLGDDDGGDYAGAFYILFLNADKTVKETHKVSALEGNFNGWINSGDQFGWIVASIGDINGDGIIDLLTSSCASDDGGSNIGKAFVLYMNIDGTVKDYNEINNQSNGLNARLEDEDYFGFWLSCFSGVNSNGKKEILISSAKDDDGATDAGAVYIMDLEVTESKQAPISNVRKISATQGGFTGTLHSSDQFAYAEAIGDVDGDGIEDMAVGAPGDNSNKGAIWILFLNGDRTVKRSQKINETEGEFQGDLDYDDALGWSLSAMGDFNNDGIPDLAAGAYFDGDGGFKRGAVWILFLNTDGTVKGYKKISSTSGGLTGLTDNRMFGAAVENIGDLDGDGVTDLAVGTPLYDDDGGMYRGCVWILFLNGDGSVKAQQKMNGANGGLGNILDDGDKFGFGIANVGDIDNDGTQDIAVGAPFDDDGATDTGAFYILFLNKNGTVKSKQKISATEGNFSGLIKSGDVFGYKISSLGDVDGNGVEDIIVTSTKSDDGGTDRGKVWILYLNNNGTVSDYNEINSMTPGFETLLDNGDRFGISFSYFQQLTSKNKKEMVIGAAMDDDGFTDAGAVYIMDLDVKHKPTANAGENAEVCVGSAFSINGSASSVLDNDPLQYSWKSNNYKLIDSTSVVLNFAATNVKEVTNYEFVLTITCDGIISDPDTTFVTVYPVSEKPEIVQDGAKLTASVNAAQYEWYLNGEIVANYNTKTIEVVKSGYYQVKAFNEIGCSAEASDSLLVMLNPIAVASAQSEFCSGETIELDASKSEKVTNDEMIYLWKSNQLVLEDSTSEKISVKTPYFEENTNIEFYLTVEQNGMISLPDTISIVVHPSPAKPVITIEDNKLSIADEGLDMQWYSNGIYIQNAIDSEYTADYNGYYFVQTTNKYGCYSAMSDSVEVLMIPTAKAYGSKKVCSGTMLYLDGSESSSPVIGTLEYHWSSNLMEVPDENLVDPSFITPVVQDITEYEFYLQVSQNDIYSPADTLKVTINPSPVQPEIEQFADTLKASTATNYQWFINNEEIDGATAQTYFVKQSGLYYVKVANEYGCVSDPSRELNVFKTSIDGTEYAVEVFPNPTSGWVTIKGLSVLKNIEIEVYNLNGQVVSRCYSENGVAKTDLRNLNEGVYTIVINKKYNSAFKLLKTNN